MSCKKMGDQIRRMGMQIYGAKKAETFLDYYREATSSKPYSYLFLDLTPEGNPEYEIRSGGILPGTYPLIFPTLR